MEGVNRAEVIFIFLSEKIRKLINTRGPTKGKGV